MARMVDFLSGQKHIPVPMWTPPGIELTHEQRKYMGGLEKLMADMNESNFDLIPKLPVFEITNVHHYVMDKEIDDIYKEWPCLMLPLDMMWMEYKRGDERNPSHVGALLMRNDDLIQSLDQWEFKDEVAEHGKYAIGLTCYFADGKRVVGPIGIFDVALDEAGAPLDFRYNHMRMSAVGHDMKPEQLMLQKMAPFYQALAFMHCKNMRFQKEEPAEKLSKKWQRKTGKPLLKWNTLIIDPLRDTLSRDRRGNTPSGPSSLHIARGHFAEYGPEFKKPDGSSKGLLFGKYAGRFWVSQHTRGTTEAGVVQHDYEVKADE